MANAGTLSVDVQARIGDVIDKFNQLETRADRFASKLSKTGNTDYFAPVQQSLKRMGTDFKQIVQGIVLAQTFYSGLQGFKTLTAAVYEYTDALEYAKVTFGNLFKDYALGDEFTAVLQQYAAKSPFDFTGIEQGARQLSAYGIEAKNLMYVIEGIGNLAAVTGDSQTFETVSRAIGQINAKGKLSAEEMRQLAEAGLNVKSVYARLGVEAGNLAEANIDSATAINAIVDTLNTEYAGAMDAANTTMRGLIGNIKDTLLSISSAIVTPLYKNVQGVLNKVQERLDIFRANFTENGLASAIEEAFGGEVLTRIQQFLAIAQMLGTTLFQVLAPAMQLLAMYGSSIVAVVGLLLQILLPMIQGFAKLANTIMQNAQAMKILQGVLMSLAVMKVIGGFASFLSGALGLLTHAIGRLVATVSVASKSLLLFAETFAITGSAATAAGTAVNFFNSTLKTNAIVRMISLVLMLVTAFVGLRAVLGQTSDGLANMSGLDFSKYLNDIKAATGDEDKFNNALEGTSDGIDDINDGLNDTKKTQKDLLSFDEVFRLPERETPSGSTSIPEISMPALPSNPFEDFNLDDLKADLLEIPDLFDKIPWKEICSSLGAALLDAWSTAFKNAAKTLNKALPKYTKPLWQRLKKVPTKITSYLKKVPEVVSKPFKTAVKTLKTLPSEVSTAIKNVPDVVKSTFSKVSTHVKSAFTDIPGTIKSAVKGIPNKVKPVFDTLGNTLKKISPIKKFTISIRDEFDELGNVIKKFKLPKITLGAFPSIQLPKSWYTIAEDIYYCSRSIRTAVDDFIQMLKHAFSTKNFGEIIPTIKSFGKDIADSIRFHIKPSEWFSSINPKEAIKSFGTKLKEAFKPSNIANFLKTAGKDFGLTLIGEFLFDQLEQWLRDNGMTEAATFAENFGGVVASGLATFIVTRNPFAALGAVVITAIFEGVEEGLETGDFSQAANSIISGVGMIIMKAVGKGNPLVFLGSLLSEMILGTIADNMEANGDESGAEIVRTLGDILGGAIGGAGLGFALGGPIGALVGAIIGGLVSGLAAHWDEVVAFFSDFPNKISEAFAGAKDWLHEHGIDVLDGFLGGIQQSWIGIWDFFNGLFGVIQGFFTGDDELLNESGDRLINGFWEGINGAFETVRGFFSGISKIILGLIVGEDSWLYEQGCNLIDGFWNGISAVFEDVKLFFSGLFGVIGALLTGDDEALKENGKKLIDGFWNGIQDAFKLVTDFFGNILKTIWGLIVGEDSELYDKGCNLIDGFFGGIQEIWNTVTNFFRGIPDEIGKFFENPGEWLANAGKALIDGFMGAAQGVWDSTCDFFSGIGDWIVQHKGPVEEDEQLLKPAGEAIMEGFDASLQQRYAAIQDFFSNIGNTLQGYFNGAVDWLQTAGNNIMNGLHSSIDAAFDKVKQLMNGMQNQIQGPFKDAINWLGSAGEDIVNGLKNGIDTGENMISDFARITKEKVEELGRNITNGLKDALREGYDQLESFIRGAKDKISSLAGDIKRGLEDAFSKGSQLVSGFFEDIKRDITSGFNGSGDWLEPQGRKISAGLCNGMRVGVTDITNIVSSMRTSITGQFIGTETWLTQPGTKLLQGLCTGMQVGISMVNTVIQSVNSAIQQGFAATQSSVASTGKRVIASLVSGMASGISQVSGIVQQLHQTIVTGYQTIINSSIKAGKEASTKFIQGYQQCSSNAKQILANLVNIFKQAYNQVIQNSKSGGSTSATNFTIGIRQLPNSVSQILQQVLSVFRNVYSQSMQLASQAGIQTMYGFGNGLNNGKSSILNIIYQVPNMIISAFSGLNNILYNAGWNIMISFGNGLVNAFKSVQNFVRSIGPWIKNNKGPEKYDKELLEDNGTWIIEGLGNGMVKRFADLKSTVKGFGGEIARSMEVPSLSISRQSVPSIPATSMPTYTAPQQVTTTVDNPYVSQTSTPDNRPVVYVNTMIADKQGLRELNRQLELVTSEKDRWK